MATRCGFAELVESAMASARPLRLAALAGIGSLAGCSANPRSCDLEASAIVLYATVTDTDEGVEVELKLETGVDVDDSSGTPLSLCTDAGERLEVNGLPAKEQRVLGQIYYVIDSSAPMAIYTIDYVRDEGTISIELAMPPTLELLAPTEGAAIPRADFGRLVRSEFVFSDEEVVPPRIVKPGGRQFAFFHFIRFPAGPLMYG